jgi:hypothetical protein
MQEEVLYSALLADLSDSQLVDVFSKEIKRRGHQGIVYIEACEKAYSGAALPMELIDEQPTTAHQLFYFGTRCGMAYNDGEPDVNYWAV